jgi:hypothetical protein
VPDTPLTAVASPGAASHRISDPGIRPILCDSLLSPPPLTIDLMNSQPEGVVIDAALRFARSNPDLLRYAHENAGRAGVSVDDLLREAIERVVVSRRRESGSWSASLEHAPDSPVESGAGTLGLSHAGRLPAPGTADYARGS